MQRVGLETLIKGGPPPGPGDALGRDWVDVLRDVPLFSGLSKRDVKKIADAARARRFAEGSTIIRTGERGETFYVILDGEADVIVGKRRTATLGAGGFFGELALLDGEPRSATITARKPTLAMALSRRSFLKLLTAEPELAVTLLKGLAARLRAAEKQPS